MPSQIITIDNVETKLITIDNVATEVVTVETVEVITIEGVGTKGNKGDNGGIPEAPEDGNQYARKDADWEVVDAGGDVDSVNGKTGVVVLDADDIDDTSTLHKFVTAAQIVVIDSTSGTNTGDQDISGIGDNATAITTINETAIFIDPASPQDIELNWKGNNVEYDALTPSASTIHFIVQLQTLLTATVTGDENVEGGDTEIYSATYTGNADDVTYLWTVTGSAYANINGSDTGQAVTVDYTQGIEIEDVDIKCVLTSVNAQDSVEDTLPVELIPDGFILWTQSFKITDTVNDVIYGIDPAVSEWVSYGTSATNLTQTNPSNQFSVVAGSTNVVRFDDDDYMDDVEQQTGEWSYYYEGDFTASLGLLSRLLDSDGASQGYIQKGTDDTITIRSDQAGNQAMPGYTVTAGLKKLLFIKDSVNLYIYENGALVSTKAVLAHTFTNFTILGRSVNSMRADLSEFKVLDRALTDQEAIDATT